MKSQHKPVAIIGGGPVGLNLALYLDKLGIASVVFDIKTTSRWHPKGSTHNSRTMEHYRWLGIASMLRELGMPKDYPKDVAYFTAMCSEELARFNMPSEERIALHQASSSQVDQVPEPLLRTNQMYVESFLLDWAKDRANITLRFGWQVEFIEQNDNGVRLTASCESGSYEEWHATYCVGCDGANSFLRRHLGLKYEGMGNPEESFLSGSMVSSYIKISNFYEHYAKINKAWMYNIISTQSRLILISLNGVDEFLIMHKGGEGNKLPGPNEVRRLVTEALGSNLDLTVIRSLTWTGGIALTASKYQQGRLFLCGDSCHLFSPTGGYGMNTGIDDARNLSWKLAAVLSQWGGSELLQSYEMERKPVAKRNTEAALHLTKRLMALQIPQAIDEMTPAGKQARFELGRSLLELRSQFSSLGVELGARYDHSPIVFTEDTIRDVWEDYVPTAIPGGRLPHMWLSSGDESLPPSVVTHSASRTSIYDLLGLGFTLLRIGASAPSATIFLRSAAKLGMPFKVVEIPEQPGRELYGKKLVLVRPDHYVAWRGDDLSVNPDHILRQCTGWEYQ